MAKDAFRYFRIEARELLDQLGARVLDLEHGATGREGVPALLRLAHTLKGAARVVRQPGIAEAAHRIEDALVPWRDEGGAVAREGIATVLSELASVETLLAALPAPEGGAPAGAAAPGGASPRPDKEARSLRTDVAQMDGLLGGIARAHALVDGLRRSRGDAASARTFVRRLRTPAAAGMSVPGPGGGVAHDSGALVDALHTAVDRLDQGLGESIEHIERELRELQERAERLRLVPADIVFAKLERSARDVAGSLGKEVELQTQGGDVRVDASMLEVVEGALVQLVRNAVAHGIEMPARRQSQGKPRAGRITVEVRRSGRRLLFVCGDDGAGIDLDAVRRTARRKGLLADGAADDEPTLLALLMQGDLSTSPVVTEIAGRGVGLDLARAAAERLGGSLSARTVANRGTTLELAVPISLAALDVLMVRAGGGVAGVPLDALRRTVRLGAGDIGRSGPRETIEVDGRSVPYVALARLLRPDEAVAAPERVTALLVEHGQAWAAVGVDRLHEVAAAVLRPLPEFAPACDLVAGLLVGVDGLPRLVLDPAAMIHAAQRAEAAPGTNRPVPDPVLVVDDSLTTRMLETSILESAGYAVDAAVSGEEGLERARRRRYALFLVDVEMPGMDGFTFIERTRADPALRDIPAVLVSSRASLADRQRGAAAGAQGYIVKGEFVQDEFLARVRQLVGTP